MNKYCDNPGAIGALVRDDEVHRDVYTDAELFALEQEHLFRNTWIYLGHDSQAPKPGDFYTADVARRRRCVTGAVQPLRVLALVEPRVSAQDSRASASRRTAPARPKTRRPARSPSTRSR